MACRSANPFLTTEYNEKAILDFLINSGRIDDIDGVVADMNKKEIERTIKKYHSYPITQGNDKRWRTYIKREDGTRKQIAKSSREKVIETLYEHYKSKEEVITTDVVTLTMLYPKWLDYKRAHGISSTSIKRFNSNWKTYYEGSHIAITPISKLSKMDFDLWAHNLIGDLNNSKKEYYNVSSLARQIIDMAVDMELIQENVFRKVKIDNKMMFNPVKKKSSETQVFTKEEVKALCDCAWNDYEKGHNIVHKLAPLAIVFQFNTGVRIGELCALRYEDIEGAEILVQRMYRFEEKEVVEYTKGHNAGRYVILTKEALKVIETARKYQETNGLDSNGYIFSVNNEPLSYYAIRKLYARYCELIGTVNKSSHKSRKTYISALVASGANIDFVRSQVGHAEARTTYNSYVYDRNPKAEQIAVVERALST